MVSNRGIEVDPKKVKAIIDIPPPRNLKQLRILQGKINSINRHISQLGNKCRPFTHLLKKNVKFVWDVNCQKAFEYIKQYFLNPPYPCFHRFFPNLITCIFQPPCMP